jgi:hypothetical protein
MSRPLTWVSQHRRWLLGTAAALVLAAALPAGPMPTVQAQAASCQFVLGFAVLQSMIGAGTVGPCRENQHTAPNGDTWQVTIKGQMEWRKADNRTVFTDGYRTWLYGPTGLQSRLNTERFAWEAEAGAVGTTTIDPPAPLPTGAAMLGMFVPCAAPIIGRDARDSESSSPQPGMYHYGCDAPDGPRVLQTLHELTTNGLATRSFDRTVAETLDPRSGDNQLPDIDPWFEIPSPGPAGSRSFKRLLRTLDGSLQLEVFTVQGRYVAGVVLNYPQSNDGLVNYTPAHASEILTALLARIPS